MIFPAPSFKRITFGWWITHVKRNYQHTHYLWVTSSIKQNSRRVKNKRETQSPPSKLRKTTRISEWVLVEWTFLGPLAARNEGHWEFFRYHPGKIVLYTTRWSCVIWRHQRARSGGQIHSIFVTPCRAGTGNQLAADLPVRHRSLWTRTTAQRGIRLIKTYPALLLPPRFTPKTGRVSISREHCTFCTKPLQFYKNYK